MSRIWRTSLAAAAVASGLGGSAVADGVVVCDAKIKRIAQALRDKAATLTPGEAERGREALMAAILACRPLGSGTSPRVQAPAGDGGLRQRVEQGVDLDRQSLRAEQNRLYPAQTRDAERSLDAIRRRSASDPYAAREMQKIHDLDRALSTMERPGPENRR